jgi:hypothetical protein
MSDRSSGTWPVPPDTAELFSTTFDDIASAGNAWTGAEKVAIANAARHESTPVVPSPLPEAAIDAAALIASRSRVPGGEWVSEVVASLGETRYVELVGVTAAVTAVDTVTRLLGHGHGPLPEPRSGEPVPPPHDAHRKRRSAWVAMNGPANPKHAVSGAPRVQETVTRLLERLYISETERIENGTVRGLSREQRELVALKVSHSNECFW